MCSKDSEIMNDLRNDSGLINEERIRGGRIILWKCIRVEC